MQIETPVTSQADKESNDKAELPKKEESTSPKQKGYRLLWAQLLKRVFKFNVLECEKCKGKMKLIALINEADAVQKICEHLNLPTSLPEVLLARAPPQQDWCE